MTEIICRLCLQTTIKNYETIRESLLKTFKLNLNVTKGNAMCTECASHLQVFSNFKAASVYGRDRILPLSNLENYVNLDPVKIETTTNQESHVEMEIKCSFCAITGGRESFVSLNESNKYESLVNMLKQHIPEMNLNIPEELLTCATCLDALQGVVSFILKCLEVEEEINRYIEMEGTDLKGQVELKDVRQFRCRSTIKFKTEPFDVYELGGGCSGEIKTEYVTSAEAEIKYEREVFEPELVIKPEAVYIKSEQSDLNGFEESVVKNKIAGAPSEMSVVTPDTRHEKIGTRRMLVHKGASEMKMFKCEMCSYEAKRKDSFNYHLLSHRSPSEINMLKCTVCPYETYRRENLRQHLLIHRSPSEANMFKCEICSYKTTVKRYLKVHLATHKSLSEMEMFKCTMCLYEAKHKENLKRHLLTHQSCSEIKMFKCEMCPFETFRKDNLRQHLLTHRSPSETDMFKCEICSYKTNIKRYLKDHLATHKSSSEINMFKCEECPYETKIKKYLRRHLLTHKFNSEANLFKCEQCRYKTYLKGDFNDHLLSHKGVSQINVFKCESCSFETKHKNYLRNHLLIHKSPSEIKMFKCEMCSFETKRKYHLKRHLLTHESASEVNTFKCEKCPYKTNYKASIKRHSLVHNSPADMNIFLKQIENNA